MPHLIVFFNLFMTQDTRLSQGATVRHFNDWSRRGFVRQGKPGARGRTDHQITSAGRKQLKNGCRTLLDDGPSGDLDADLRVALLILWAGGERRLAVDFLRQSAIKRAESIESVAEAGQSEPSVPLASWYSSLRSDAVKALLAAEFSALSDSLY